MIEVLIRVLRMEANRSVFPETICRYGAGDGLRTFTPGEPPLVELGPVTGYWPD